MTSNSEKVKKEYFKQNISWLKKIKPVFVSKLFSCDINCQESACSSNSCRAMDNCRPLTLKVGVSKICFCKNINYLYWKKCKCDKFVQKLLSIDACKMKGKVKIVAVNSMLTNSCKSTRLINTAMEFQKRCR